MLFYRRKQGRGELGRAAPPGSTMRPGASAPRDGANEEPKLYDLKHDGTLWSLVLAW